MSANGWGQEMEIVPNYGNYTVYSAVAHRNYWNTSQFTVMTEEPTRVEKVSDIHLHTNQKYPDAPVVYYLQMINLTDYQISNQRRV